MSFLRRGLKREAAIADRSQRLATVVATDPEGPWPLWVLREADPGSSPVEPLGALDAGPVAYVDERGLISWDGGRWSLDWWVRTEEGWRYPSRTRSVRQEIGAVPVVQTSFAVPGGSLVALVYAVQGQKGPGLVIAYENQSGTAIALALALRPIDNDGLGIAETVKVYDGTIAVDGVKVLRADRTPAASVAATDFAALAAGVERANVETSTDATSPDGRAQAALIFPMPHSSRLQVLLGADLALSTVPSLEAVSKGWTAHLDQFFSVEVEGDDIGERLATQTRRLATSIRKGRVVRPRNAVEDWTLVEDLTVAESLLAAGDTNVAAELVMASLDSDRLLALTNREREAAFNSFTRLWQFSRRPELLEATEESLDVPLEVLAGATPPPAGSDSKAWPVVAARETAALQNVFVSVAGGELHLLGGFDIAWRGRTIDVRNARTPFGRISYSLRWHGERPALLWELEPFGPETNDANPSFVVRVPELDDSWSSTERAGEALLAPQPV